MINLKHIAILGFGVFAASQSYAQEAGDDLEPELDAITPNYSAKYFEDFKSQIVKCEVNAQGFETVTLQNGDSIANPEWHSDSFSIAVEDVNGDASIYNPNTNTIIQVSDICVRTDSDVNPELKIETDLKAFDRLCVESGLFVEVFERKTGVVSLEETSIESVFGEVAGNEHIIGVCSFEFNGQLIRAPILSKAAYDLLP